MPHHPDEVVSYTRDDLLQALAGELGSRPMIRRSWMPMTRSTANGH
jgi:hypothetical protein